MAERHWNSCTIEIHFSKRFSWTLEVPLINCQINLILTGSENWVKVLKITLPITDKSFLTVFSTQDNTKLVEQFYYSYKKQSIGININAK